MENHKQYNDDNPVQKEKKHQKVEEIFFQMRSLLVTIMRWMRRYQWCIVYIDGNELKREIYLKYPGITFDRSLCGNEHVTRTSCREIKALRAFCNRFELANSFWFKATVRGVMENQEQDFDE